MAAISERGVDRHHGGTDLGRGPCRFVIPGLVPGIRFATAIQRRESVRRLIPGTGPGMTVGRAGNPGDHGRHLTRDLRPSLWVAVRHQAQAKSRNQAFTFMLSAFATASSMVPTM